MSGLDNFEICSNASGMSEVSVSMNGTEMLLEEAVDQIFKELQEHINHIHCQLRQLCQCEDRNDTYDEAKEFLDEIVDHIKEGNKVMKELIPVCKQLMPKKPKGWKDPNKLGAVQE